MIIIILTQNRYIDIPQTFEPTTQQNMHLHKTLIRMGFHTRDVDQALASSLSQRISSLQDALDWLCLHASEENLPKKFAPTKGNIQLVVHSKQGKEEKKEEDELEGLDDKKRAMAMGMIEWGFVGKECSAVFPRLDETLFDSEGEAYVLKEMFNAVFKNGKVVEEVDFLSLEEIRSEEYVVLESIFGSDFERYTIII